MLISAVDWKKSSPPNSRPEELTINTRDIRCPTCDEFLAAYVIPADILKFLNENDTHPTSLSGPVLPHPLWLKLRDDLSPLIGQRCSQCENLIPDWTFDLFLERITNLNATTKNDTQSGAASTGSSTPSESSPMIGSPTPGKASGKQVGGDHYKTPGLPDLAWFVHAHKLGFFEASAMKYLFRHKKKGGRQDLEKAKHYIDLLIEYEYPE